MKPIDLLAFFCSLMLVFAVSAAEVSFVTTDSDGNTASGTISAFDANRLVLDADGRKTEIPMEKLVKLQSLFDNPFVASSPIKDTSDLLSHPSNYSPARNFRGRTDEIRQMKIAEQRLRQQSEEDSGKAKSGSSYPDVVSVLELKDTSRLVVTDFTAKGASATCRLLNGEEMTLPLNQLLAVRFVVKGLTEATNLPEDWQKLAAKTDKGDRIVVGQPGSLDVYVGVLAEVGQETISFIVDNETLPVPRRKVFGLLLHTPENVKNTPTEPLLGSLKLWNGTTVAVHSLKRNENDHWTWTTVSGISGKVLPEEIDELDLGRKNAFYLTDLKPALLEQAFFFDWETPVKADALALFRTFRMNKIMANPAEQEKIFSLQPQTDARQKKVPDRPLPGLEGYVLEGVSYEHGLVIPAKTVLEYTLTEPFTAFHAVAGIDDRLRPDGAVRLRIEAGQQQLGDWEFRGDEPAKLLKLDLPSGAKTLKFEVDFTKGITAPNVLTLADPKLIK